MTLQEIRDERDFVKRSIEGLLTNFNKKTGLTITDVHPDYIAQNFIGEQSDRPILIGVRLTVTGI